ncbi:response regulator transcription factor [Caproicibacter sp. BJN0012]|uniref:response regulator transcription factor n=1 Tax=Caproicibacter sp. BJN0012 TaxID=3110227 RepID=UPI002E0F4D91
MEYFKILIADDEEAVRRLISRILESEGMISFQAANGSDTLTMLRKQTFDLILLDVMMDGMDGFSALREIRSHGITTPVIILSGKKEDCDKVFGLEIGADDYITKPFSPPVLTAKVKACLRRSRIDGRRLQGVLEAGPFQYLCDEMRLMKNGTEIVLSGRENMMMKYFLSNLNRILTKEQIYNHVWGNRVVDDNTIMVHIRHLRMKIEDNPDKPVFLKTVRGLGYQFSV